MRNRSTKEQCNCFKDEKSLLDLSFLTTEYDDTDKFKEIEHIIKINNIGQIVSNIHIKHTLNDEHEIIEKFNFTEKIAFCPFCGKKLHN